MPSLFITGTDTGVGKTVVTAAVAGALSQRGQHVCVYKPVQTGAQDVSAPDDPMQVQMLCGDRVNVAWTYCLPTPAAPYISDQVDHTGGHLTIRPERLLAEARRFSQACDWLLIEGAGGLRVPLAPQYDMLDLLEDIGCPALVVARPNLGTVNHTLLTVSQLQQREVPLAGVVVSGMPSAKALAAWPDRVAVETLPALLQELLPDVPQFYLPAFQVRPGLFAPDSPDLAPALTIASALLEMTRQ